MEKHTSVQVNLPGMVADGNQSEMFAEFSGKDGKVDTLIDVEQELAKLQSKPLPGQIKLEGGDI